MSTPGPTLDLNECDKEPIHIPGVVQPHGVILVLDPDTLVVQKCSANTLDLLHVAPDQLLGRPFTEWVDPEVRTHFPEALQPTDRQFSNPLHVPVCPPDLRLDFDGIVHRTDDALILELEPTADRPEEKILSRSLEHHFRLTERSLPRLHQETSIRRIAAIICDEVRRFTGFDRVMLYRFAPDFHGEVIGEARQEQLEPLLGLHYPATDIPKQARELYKRNWVRLIHDVRSTPVPLVPATGDPLDMSDCALRGVSPIHIQYLKNMGVASSMSISLLSDGELWGLIACHHYSGPHFVSYAKRISCVHFGIMASSQIRLRRGQIAAEELSSRRADLVLETRQISGHAEFRDAMSLRADSLMRIVRADGMTVIIGGRQEVRAGTLPSSDFVDRLYPMIGTDRPGSDQPFYSHALGQDLPALAPVPSESAGVLQIELGDQWTVLFFRSELVQTVRWGGDPNKAMDPAQPLTPRQSFAEWSEQISGQSRLWSDPDLTIADELRSSLMAFVVLRNRQLDQVNRHLAAKNAEVAQFAYTVSHDLKSPLVTVSGYVGALEEDLALNDKEAVADSLERIKRATRRMGTLIDELLKFSRIGSHSERRVAIDLNPLIAEVASDFELRIRSVGATLTYPDDFPAIVGCPDDVSRAIHNLVDNALKYGRETPDFAIGISWIQTARHVRLLVSDNGPGIDPIYHQRIFELFQRIHDHVEGTGVGLASVAKIAQQHGGDYGVDSELGNGACFWMEFPTSADPTTSSYE